MLEILRKLQKQTDDLITEFNSVIKKPFPGEVFSHLCQKAQIPLTNIFYDTTLSDKDVEEIIQKSIDQFNFLQAYLEGNQEEIIILKNMMDREDGIEACIAKKISDPIKANILREKLSAVKQKCDSLIRTYEDLHSALLSCIHRNDKKQLTINLNVFFSEILQKYFKDIKNELVTTAITEQNASSFIEKVMVYYQIFIEFKLNLFADDLLIGLLSRHDINRQHICANIKEKLLEMVAGKTAQSSIIEDAKKTLQFQREKIKEQLKTILLNPELISELHKIEKNHTEFLLHFTKNLLELCSYFLGHAPESFAIFSLGSLSLGQATPFSDIEHGLVREKKDPKNDAYFTDLLKIFHVFVLLMGETKLSRSEEDLRGSDYVGAGYHIDSGMHPLTSLKGGVARLQGTIEDITEWLIKEDADVGPNDILNYALQNIRCIYAVKGSNSQISGEDLFSSLQCKIRLINSKWYQVKSLASLHDLHSQGLWNGKQLIKLKKQFYAPLKYFLMNLADYYNYEYADLHGAIDALEQHGKITLDYAIQAKSAIAVITLIRYRQQFHYGHQKKDEYVVAPNFPSDNEYHYRLSDEEFEILQQIHITMLWPSFQWLKNHKLDKLHINISITESLIALDRFHPVIQLMDEFLEKNAKSLAYVINKDDENLIKGFVLACKLNRATKESYIAYFKKLPQSFRLSFYQYLEKSNVLDSETPELLNIISRIPMQDGYRLSTIFARDSWLKKMNQLLFVEDSQENRDLLTKNAYPAILIKMPNQQMRLVASWLFDAEYVLPTGELNLNHKDKELSGTRLVLAIRDQKNPANVIAYLKLYPEHPGNQYAQEEFCQQLSGYSSISTLIHWQMEGSEAVLPVLVSQPSGESLDKIHKRHRSLRLVENVLDEKAFVGRLLETILLSYEDDKADNICFQRSAENPEKFILIAQDADHINVRPVQHRGAVEGLFFDEQVKLKSLVLCFKQMYEALSDDSLVALEEFKQLDAKAFIDAWLHKLELWDKDYIGREGSLGLFTPSQLKAWYETHEVHFPVTFHEVHDVTRIFQNMVSLQMGLNDKEVPIEAPFDLIKRMEPILASYYEQAFAEAKKNNRLEPQTILDLVPHDWVVKEKYSSEYTVKLSMHLLKKTISNVFYSSETTFKKRLDQYREKYDELITKNMYIIPRSVKMHFHHYIRDISSERKYITDINQFIDLIETQKANPDPTQQIFIERILENINFSDMELSQQNQVLNALTGLDFSNLTIINCAALTSDYLKDILYYCKILRVLNVSGCSLTNVDFLNEWTAKFLEVLKLPGNRISCFGIEFYMKDPEKALLPSLRTLDISNMPTLKLILIDAPRLTVLKADSCPELVYGGIAAPKLISLNLKACGKITSYVQLLNFVRRSPLLNTLHLSESGLSGPKLFAFEAFPYLISQCQRLDSLGFGRHNIYKLFSNYRDQIKLLHPDVVISKLDRMLSEIYKEVEIMLLKSVHEADLQQYKISLFYVYTVSNSPYIKKFKKELSLIHSNHQFDEDVLSCLDIDFSKNILDFQNKIPYDQHSLYYIVLKIRATNHWRQIIQIGKSYSHLTNNLFKLLIEHGDNINILSIKDCNLLTEEIILDIGKHCPNIRTLTLEGLQGVSFLSLTKLVLRLHLMNKQIFKNLLEVYTRKCAWLSTFPWNEYRQLELQDYFGYFEGDKKVDEPISDLSEEFSIRL